MDKQTKRRRSSGILKKSPHRKSLMELDQNVETEDDNRRGLRRRVSFASTNQIKEICRVVDIEEKWMDKKHSVDTTNLDPQNLTISKKSKTEVGVESLNALLSAPILQVENLNRSDVALLEDATNASIITDCTSILFTPNHSSSTGAVQNCSVSSSNAYEQPQNSNETKTETPKPSLLADIPIVVPSFLHKHLSSLVPGQNMSAASDLTKPSLNDTKCDTAPSTKRSPVNLSPDFPGFKTTVEDACMEETACLQQNRLKNIASLAEHVVLNNVMLNEASQYDSFNSTSSEKGLASDEVEMTNCAIMGCSNDVQLINKENMLNEEFLKLNSWAASPVSNVLSSQVNSNASSGNTNTAMPSTRQLASENMEITCCAPVVVSSKEVALAIQGQVDTSAPVCRGDDMEVTSCLPAISVFSKKPAQMNTAPLVQDYASPEEAMEITSAKIAKSATVNLSNKKNFAFAASAVGNNNIDVTECAIKDSAKGTTPFSKDRFIPCSAASTSSVKLSTHDLESSSTEHEKQTQHLNNTLLCDDDLELTKCSSKQPLTVNFLANPQVKDLAIDGVKPDEDMEVTKCISANAFSASVAQEIIAGSQQVPKATTQSSRVANKPKNQAHIAATQSTVFNESMKLTNTELHQKINKEAEEGAIALCTLKSSKWITKASEGAVANRDSNFVSDDMNLTECGSKQVNMPRAKSASVSTTPSLNFVTNLASHSLLPPVKSFSVNQSVEDSIKNQNLYGSDIEMTCMTQSRNCFIGENIHPDTDEKLNCTVTHKNCVSDFQKKSIDVSGTISNAPFSRDANSSGMDVTKCCKQFPVIDNANKESVTSHSDILNEDDSLNVESFNASLIKKIDTLSPSSFLNITTSKRDEVAKALNVVKTGASPTASSELPASTETLAECDKKIEVVKVSDKKPNSIENIRNISSEVDPSAIQSVFKAIESPDAGLDFYHSASHEPIFTVGSPDVSGICNLSGDEISFPGPKHNLLVTSTVAQVSKFDSTFTNVRSQTNEIKRSRQELTSQVESSSKDESPLPVVNEKLASPQQNAAVENHVSAVDEEVTIKRIRLTSDTTEATSLSNVTNDLFGQDTQSESITMEKFLDMYTNLRIGLDRKSNRGKRSLVFSMDATKKPTTLSEMVTTVYNQEYKLPVYQQFQESIKKRIQGIEKKIFELENKIALKNPEIMNKIRFGSREESERLIEEVHQLGKHCKKVAKAHWKMSKNKLRKSLQEAHDAMIEKEITPMLDEFKSFGDVKQLLEDSRSKVEEARQAWESKLASLQKHEPLPTEEQLVLYRSNCEKIERLQEEVRVREAAEAERRAAEADYNKTMKQVWMRIEEERALKRKKKAAEKSNATEKRVLKKYLLWDVVEDQPLIKKFSFLDGTLVFSTKYSSSHSISSFKLDSLLEGRKCIDISLYKLLHQIILDDYEIENLLESSQSKLNLRKAMDLVSRKVAYVVLLRDDFRRLSLDIAHCCFKVEDRSILAQFYSSKPTLCMFKVKFNFVNETTARTGLSPFSYQYIEDPSSFGKFSEIEVLDNLNKVDSNTLRLFNDLCTALLKMMASTDV